MCLDHLPQVLTTVGLVLDIVGAWFIAYEVVVQYRGSKYEYEVPYVFDGHMAGDPVESAGYIGYQARKHTRMWIGLGLLTLGFLLQIASVWVK